MHNFGPRDDSEGAFGHYLREKDNLLAEKVPPAKGEDLSVSQLGNAVCLAKRRFGRSRRYSPPRFDKYRRQ
jgi:hypothetical protein